MENVLFANVQNLYDNGLYECTIPVASLLATVLQNDRNVATLEMEYQTMLYLSSANYKERNYRLACSQLEGVLKQRKTMWRYKSYHLSAIESSYTQFQDAELRYRIAKCYREMGDDQMAISVLQATKSRTPKLNMLMAKLQLHHARYLTKTQKAAAYKDVLRDCPMSLTAIEALIELGIEGSEVHSMVVNASNMSKHIEWLSSWIKAHAQMYGCKHLEAAKTFQQLNETTLLRQNHHLLTNIGKCLYYYGNFIQAELYLETAARNNTYNMNAIGLLAVVYEYNGKKNVEQETLIAPIRTRSTGEFKSPHWFLLAQLAYANSKYERALIYTDRALDIDPRNMEALLLRGKLFGGLGRNEEAIQAFRTAQCLGPYRFEIYKGLLACYIRQKRMKESHNMCALAVRYFSTSPRSYTMFGHTLFHSSNPQVKKSAKKFVEKALQIDEHYAPGIALMAGIFQHEGAAQEAIGLLRKQVTNYPHPKLFAMLAELLSSEKDLDGALHFYMKALRMEPTFRRALDGFDALTKVARSANAATANAATNKPSETSAASCASGSGSGSGSGNISVTASTSSSSSSNQNANNVTSSGGQSSGSGMNTSAVSTASTATATTAATSGSASATATTTTTASGTMATPCGTPNHEWLLDCEEMSNDVLELSSPAVAQEDGDFDTFSDDPFWQDIDVDITN
ncbi:anaphase-promoting complex subunit 7 [Drosophila albomicans]|uniref:Anaphase-promoting complex subunit 7 n=1 Tax=Drosophila albomicans TaxID=7291 RepID=A0A6P8XRF8_DROAB|nr:anaphase-promoting complex subunit 7 [Drosophila albomicans]